MADVKVSGLPVDSSLDGNHYTILNDPTGPTTKRTLLSTLAAFFFNQINIPTGSGSPITRDAELCFDHVNAGCVWSGDAYASTRLASMTSGVVYINGRRLSISAVVSRTFTASKDTYIDILDNQDGTATIVYTEVTNNAASPSLAANSIRIGIIITGATTIAAATSVNQGQETMVLPIASSIPYAVTDSLGNLICNRNPNRTLLAYRQTITDLTTTSATMVDITGLNLTVNNPTGRKVKISVSIPQMYSGGGGTVSYQVVDVTNSNAVVFSPIINPQNTQAQNIAPFKIVTPPAAGVRNYKLQWKTNSGTNHTGSAGQDTAAIFTVELE